MPTTLAGDGINEPLVVLPGEGTVRVGARGGMVLADSASTGGTLGLVEGRMPPGRSVPAHLHRREAEAWYVLEGELSFRFGDRTVVAPAGAFVFSPLEVAHSFGNAGERPARYLELFVPGGFEVWDGNTSRVSCGRGTAMLGRCWNF